MGVYRLYTGDDGESHIEELTAKERHGGAVYADSAYHSRALREPLHRRGVLTGPRSGRCSRTASTQTADTAMARPRCTGPPIAMWLTWSDSWLPPAPT